ncbi:MAG: hypothetical protein DRP96_05885 [Candidatus Neomarinimicrobiota bacterium]|nr:MAG: hypothetical protein DRP96_05885 [Candidatus Neomarinimicrobiota bacterium]
MVHSESNIYISIVIRMIDFRFKTVAVIITLIIFMGNRSDLIAQSRFTPTEYTVGKIYLSGNREFRTRKLKRQMNLKDIRFLRSKTFTRRLIELDRILLQSIYVKDGYLNAVVTDSFVVHDNGQVDLYYFITEGRQYFLREISIDGNTSISDTEILKLLNHKLDKPYNPIRIREGIKLIKEEYANYGKPLANIRDSIEVNHGIHLFINVIENPTMTIGTIRISGNNLVRNKPIEREILLKPGDPYSQRKIDLSKKHIFETGLFSSVNIRPYDIDTTNHVLNLAVDVRELDMRYLGGSVGFGQEQGIAEGSDKYTSFSLDGEWLHRNIAGRGSRLSLNMGLSVNFTNIFDRPATSASITYIEPWLFGFRSSTSFKLFYQNELVDNKSQTKYGEETSLIYQPDRRFFASAGVILQKVFWTGESNVQEVDTTTEDNERAFTLHMRRDYRDNFLFPTKGTVFSFDGKIVGTILGGTQDYYWFETSFSHYIPVWRNVVFAYRGKFGYQRPIGQKSTPQYAKFYLGGGASMRGWAHNSFLNDGGNVKVMTNAEIRFPLFWILGGEIFIDGGNLASDIPSLLNKTYRWDTGFGLTIATPLGPIRIDIAKVIGEKGKPYQWQFSIPYAF